MMGHRTTLNAVYYHFRPRDVRCFPPVPRASSCGVPCPACASLSCYATTFAPGTPRRHPLQKNWGFWLHTLFIFRYHSPSSAKLSSAFGLLLSSCGFMAFRLFSFSLLPEIMGGGGASISASGSKDAPSSSSSALLENTRR